MSSTQSQYLKQATPSKKGTQHHPKVKRGKVKWFRADKGFGFLIDEAGKEYYFNQFDFKAKDLPRSGDAVEFFPVQNKKGDRAGHVLPLSPDISTAGNPHQRNTGASTSVHQSSDARVTCRHCQRLMVPRVIMGPPLGATSHWVPVAKRSICPFCLQTHLEHPPTAQERWARMAQWAVSIAAVLIFVGVFSSHI